MRDETLFHEARQLPAGERAAFLDEACKGDVALRQQVDALLGAHDNPNSFLQQPRAEFGATVDLSPAEVPLAERAGALIGPYKLLEQIGEGGMGVVYMAEQQVPIRRRVALKVIKVGMDTRQVIARFEAKAQALALMDHSNIARVLDAGATDSGRPYFVMELVRGVPITEYCDQNKLPVHERLELFVQVCQAVQHAHQKGIIHRDIKPSNVLVTVNDGRAVPKVIDFGVAKATNQQLTEKTLFTAFAQMVGTPLYMSPEQAEMSSLDVDTRSDIYSLGVLLYELLTGTTPFDQERLRAVAYAEMVRIIREEEPPKPSTRISTLGEARTATAAHRQIGGHRLGQLVEGDLDWIVMKSLEKDRTRRYDTASGFAEDIHRYLCDQPVEARPPSARYRFGKFARRNKAALLMVSLVLVGLLTLLVGLAVSNHMIAAQRNQKTEALALAEAQSKRATTNLWRHNIAIRELMTNTAVGKDDVPLAVRQRFSAEATKYYQAMIQDGASDPSSRYETAVGFQKLGMLQTSWKDLSSSEKCYRNSIEIFEGLLAEDPGNQKYREQLGYACLGFGIMLRDGGRLEESLVAVTRGEHLFDKLLRETPDSFDYAYGSALSLRRLTVLQSRMEKYQDAKSSCSRAVELLTGLVEGRYGPDTYPTERSQNALWVEMSSSKQQMGVSFRHARQYDEAELAFRQTVDILQRATAFEPQRPYLLYTLAENHRQIGLVEIDRKRLDKAEQELRRAVEIYQQCVEKFPEEMPKYPERVPCYGDLYRLLVSTGRVHEAKSLISDIKIPPKDLPLRIFLADLLRDSGDSQQAFAEYSQLIAESPEKSEVWTGRAFSYFNHQQWEEAIADFSKAIELDPEVHTNWFHRGHAYIALAQWDKAEADFKKTSQGWTTDWDSCYRLGVIHAQMNRPAEAVADLTQAVARGFNDVGRIKTDPKFKPLAANEDFKKLLADLDEKFRPPLNTLKGSEYLRNSGKIDEAIKVCSEIISREPGNDAAWFERGNCYLRKDALATAIDDYTQAIKLNPNDGRSWHERGFCYLRLGQHEKSIVDHSKAIELSDQDAGQRQRRGDSYRALGELEKAEQDYSRAIELNPSGWENWYARARLYAQQHNAAKASSDLASLMKLPMDSDAQNGLAWSLATDPDSSWCNAGLAVELSEKAIEARPTDGMIWNTVGAARYRNGQWKDAIAAFDKSMQFRNGGDGSDWFFLAMAHWRLNDKEDARKWHVKAVEWMDKNQPKNNDLLRFRREAEELLNEKPATDANSTKPD